MNFLTAMTTTIDKINETVNKYNIPADKDIDVSLNTKIIDPENGDLHYHCINISIHKIEDDFKINTVGHRYSHRIYTSSGEYKESIIEEDIIFE